MSGETSEALRELFLTYDLLKRVAPHFPQNMKLKATIDERIESIRSVILPDPWKPISEYKGWGEVLVKMADGQELLAHWASDLSGSDQPPFEGWFRRVCNESGQVLYCAEIDMPIAWRVPEAATTETE